MDTKMRTDSFSLKEGMALSIVSMIIDETILTAGGDYLYDKYLLPKIRPHTALSTIVAATVPVVVSFKHALLNITRYLS
jgi:hypothetical protein